MMQMYDANQLRQIHEERIAPYIQNKEEVLLKASTKKSTRRSFNLFNQAKKAFQG